MRILGHDSNLGLEIHNARLSDHNSRYREYLYSRLQRQGYLERDCQRMVNQDRNVFSACMVALGDADAMVTGLTRSFRVCYDEITRAISPANDGSKVIGVTSILSRDRTVVIADTLVHEVPTPEELAEIGVRAAGAARSLGLEPRVAFLSYSTFGNPAMPSTERVSQAVSLLDQRAVDFEYEGEMSADVALDSRPDEAALSVRAPLRGGQRAGDAGAAFRQYLGQAAAEDGGRHRDRPDAAGGSKSRCRWSSWVRAWPKWSTWRPWPHTPPSAETIDRGALPP